MFPRSLFWSSFPVLCRSRDGGGIEKLKRAVPAGSHAGEKGFSENSAAAAQKAPSLLHLHAESHRAWGALRHTEASHVPPRCCLWKANNWLGGEKTTAVHPPWAGRTICPVLGNVQLSGERLEDTPPSREIPKAASFTWWHWGLFSTFADLWKSRGMFFSPSGGWKPRS